MKNQKPTQLTEALNAIGTLPPAMQDSALVPWKTVAALLGQEDVANVRKNLMAAGLPVVHLNERRKLPTWGALRQHLKALERPAS
jgi:hypothetical protein